MGDLLMKLTDKSVARIELPPGKGDAIFFDDEVTGLGVRLRAGCRPIWIYQYRVGAKQRRYQIGPVAKLKAAMAREKAEELQARVVLGEDPQVVKADAKAERIKKDAAAKHTVGALIELYIEDKEKALKLGKLRPSTIRGIRRYLRSHWKPLHRLQVDDVERNQIAVQLRAIEKKSGSTAAKHARSALQSFFAWAMAQGFSRADASPVIGTLAPETAPPRERVLTREELGDVWRACGDDDFGRAMRLLICTGCRRQEIGSMAWSEIRDGIWTIPADRAKNRRQHSIPLVGLAAEIVASVPKVEGRDLLFGLGPNGFRGWHIAGEALRKRIEKPMPHWVAHDLRRSVVTHMAEIGIEPHIIEAVVNHISGHKGGVAGIYNRAKYGPRIRQALDRWDAELRAIGCFFSELSEDADKTGANIEGGQRKVVPLHVAV